MKILHINTTLGKGGAANLMADLAYKIKEMQDVEACFIVAFSSRNSFRGVSSLKDSVRYPKGYKKLTRILSERFFQYRYLPLEYGAIISELKRVNPDIIHLHNIHGGYFETSLLKKMSEFAPVIWTFHDMFNFTGHCAYSFDCERWGTGCGKCPHLYIPPAIKKDRTKANLKYKKKIYESSNFTIITPSKWLYDCVKRSVLKDKDIRLIHNGIDTDIFKKTDKFKARDRLSLPKDKKIILFSADGGVENPFKGGKFVFDVYENLKKREDILFLNIGGEENSVSGNWRNYGYIESENEMALMCSAADIYLFPTLADNCPLSVIESMSCGLPVVTFDVGGVPEIIAHEKTGYIAKYKDPDDLLHGVNMLLDDENLRSNLGEAGEKRARELFDAKAMTQKYHELYKEALLGKN